MATSAAGASKAGGEGKKVLLLQPILEGHRSSVGLRGAVLQALTIALISMSVYYSQWTFLGDFQTSVINQYRHHEDEDGHDLSWMELKSTNESYEYINSFVNALIAETDRVTNGVDSGLLLMKNAARVHSIEFEVDMDGYCDLGDTFQIVSVTCYRDVGYTPDLLYWRTMEKTVGTPGSFESHDHHRRTLFDVSRGDTRATLTSELATLATAYASVEPYISGLEVMLTLSDPRDNDGPDGLPTEFVVHVMTSYILMHHLGHRYPSHNQIQAVGVISGLNTCRNCTAWQQFSLAAMVILLILSAWTLIKTIQDIHITSVQDTTGFLSSFLNGIHTAASLVTPVWAVFGLAVRSMPADDEIAQLRDGVLSTRTDDYHETLNVLVGTWRAWGCIMIGVEGLTLFKYGYIHAGMQVFTRMFKVMSAPIKDFAVVFFWITFYLSLMLAIIGSSSGLNEQLANIYWTILTVLYITFGYVGHEELARDSAGLGADASLGINVVFWVIVFILVVVSQNVLLAIVASAYETATEILGRPKRTFLTWLLLKLWYQVVWVSMKLRGIGYRQTTDILLKNAGREGLFSFFWQPDFALWSLSDWPGSETLLFFFTETGWPEIHSSGQWPETKEEYSSWVLRNVEDVEHLNAVISRTSKLVNFRHIVFRFKMHKWGECPNANSRSYGYELLMYLLTNFSVEESEEMDLPPPREVVMAEQEGGDKSKMDIKQVWQRAKIGASLTTAPPKTSAGASKWFSRVQRKTAPTAAKTADGVAQCKKDIAALREEHQAAMAEMREMMRAIQASVQGR